MNNIVVKSIKKEDGFKIVELFKKLGVDTGTLVGSDYSEGGYTCVYYGVINNEFSNFRYEELPKNIEILTIEELKLKLKQMGYRFKKEFQHMEKAACAITETSGLELIISKGICFTANSYCKELLEKAGVLDIWFEPVQDFKERDWVVVLFEDSFYQNAEQGIAQCILKIYPHTHLKYVLDFSSGLTNVYSKVRFATPEEIIKAKALRKISIGGHELEIVEGKAKFGCQRFTKQEITTLKDFITNKDIDFKCSVNSISITSEFLTKILDKL